MSDLSVEQSNSLSSEVLEPSVKVTNRELIARVTDANRLYARIDTIPENLLKVTGKAAEYFSIERCDIRPDQDSSERSLYNPEEGQVVVLAIDVDNRDVAKRFFQVDDIPGRLEQAQADLRKRGVNLVFIYQTTPPTESSGRPGGYSVTEERALYLGIGKKAGTDRIKSLLCDKPEDLGYLDRRAELNDFTLVELEFLDRSTRYSKKEDGSFKEGKPEYGFPQLVVRVPYSSESDINIAIEELNQAFAALKDAGLFPIAEGQSQLGIEFQGARKVLGSEVQVALTIKAYARAIQVLKDSITEPTDQYTVYFTEDLKRVKFLPYAEAVKRTQQILPTILNKEIIARYEVCDLVKTGGRWNILLPSGDFLPPEDVYWAQFLHSKIEETWGRSGRKYPPLDENPVRGYFIEFASGKRALATEKPDQLKAILPQLNQEYQISDLFEESSDPFEQTVYTNQITKALELDANFLKQAGVSDSDIQFYNYWAKRFWLTREDSLETIYDVVEKRFKYLQDLILREKKK